MSTSNQDPKVLQIETLGIASADAEMHGQKLRDALAQAYWGAQNGDCPRLTRAYKDVTEHATAMRKTLASAAEALDALVGEPEPELDKFRDLVSRVEQGVREEENGTLSERSEAAAKTIFRARGYAEILALVEYARRAMEHGPIDEPDAIDSVRFFQRLSSKLFDAYSGIEKRRWKNVWSELQGSLADLAIYRKVEDVSDQYLPECDLAAQMVQEIDGVGQYVHQQLKAEEA